MTANEYQAVALKTANGKLTIAEQLSNGALGLSGEASEVVEQAVKLLNAALELSRAAGGIADYVKKGLYQEHALDIVHLNEELGDCLWYIALLSDIYGWKLEEVMLHNIAKLRRRYRDGQFSGEASIARSDMT